MSDIRHRALPIAFLIALGMALLPSSPASAGSRSASLPPINSCPGAKVCEWVALHDLLPQDISSSGVLTFATDPETPPYEFYASNHTTIIGFEIDIAKAIAGELGLKAQFTALSFPGIIAAIEAGRFDASITGMADTPVREKQINFVEDSWSGESLVVATGNPRNITTVADMCGNTAAVVSGSVPLGIMETQAKTCSQSGKAKLTISILPNLSAALLAVASGRANATIVDSNYGGYFIKSSHSTTLQVVTATTFGTGYNAIGVAKSDLSLLLCIQQAEQRLIDNGAYGNILTSWGIPANEFLTSALVNDGLRFNQPTG